MSVNIDDRGTPTEDLTDHTGGLTERRRSEEDPREAYIMKSREQRHDVPPLSLVYGLVPSHLTSEALMP